MLILFDIDGTLLHVTHEGGNAMELAGRELYGPSFSMAGVDYAGRLDSHIWRQAAERNGLSPADAETGEASFRAAYARHFGEVFGRGSRSTVLPGVRALVDAVAAVPEWTSGVLTGNYPETGAVKLTQAGLDPDAFPVQVWATDGDHRRDLPAVALERWRARCGGDVDPRRAIVIGDTPHDIDCAKHNGCRVLAVGTGPSFSHDELRRLEPDHFVEDLAATDSVMEWLHGCD